MQRNSGARQASPAVSGRPASARHRDPSRERTSSSGTAGRVRLLTQAPAGTSLAVVAPVPLDGGGAAKVGTLLREAIEQASKGAYGDAVAAPTPGSRLPTLRG